MVTTKESRHLLNHTVGEQPRPRWNPQCFSRSCSSKSGGDPAVLFVSWVHETLWSDLCCLKSSRGWLVILKNVHRPFNFGYRTFIQKQNEAYLLLRVNQCEILVGSGHLGTIGDPIVAKWQPRQGGFRYTADGDPLGSRAGSHLYP
jgi:hypothetical protein